MANLRKDPGPKDRRIDFHPDDERRQAYRKFAEVDEEMGPEEGERRWEENPQDDEPGEDS